jgi:hypothetical protein
MRRLVELRDRRNSRYPLITFRYILFRWNDTDEIMDLTRELARDIGVDRLCWELTDHPDGCPSERFQPGSPDYELIKNEIWGVGANANALDEKRPQAEIVPNTSELNVPQGSTCRLSVAVTNRGNELWFATAPDNIRFVTLGIQLLDKHGSCINRDFHRTLLPTNIHPGQQIDLEVECPAPNKGQYLLKFDMVLEGYGWFESGASPVILVPLAVTE